VSRRVVVVDVGLGNLRSVQKALETAGRSLGAEVARSADPERIRSADQIVVPGQGGFGALARKLDGGLRDAILERLRAGTPYLGICLGLQILFESSSEAPDEAGFGWFEGGVERLDPGDAALKIPHMGWNQVEFRGAGHPLLSPGEWYYFVHSYHAVPRRPDVLAAVATYGAASVTAAVSRDNVLATQFHPEKSQAAGLRLLAGFLSR
jgi:glutamine amidotransferase